MRHNERVFRDLVAQEDGQLVRAGCQFRRVDQEIAGGLVVKNQLPH